MRHGSSSPRRQRNRNSGGRRGNQNNRSQVFDSNGPEVRIRGTAHQVCEKYLALAKDSKSSGDHVLAESYLQHAEHYQRIINEFDANSTQNNERQKSSHKHDDQKSSQNASKNSSRDSSKKPAPKGNQSEKDDLGLPGSILGEGETKTEATTDDKTKDKAEA